MDVSSGDGVCGDGDRDCTLRAAIMEANAQEGADIVLPAGTYTLTLGSPLVIDKGVTLTGDGAATTIIQAADEPKEVTTPVFVITEGHVAISGVTIRHGRLINYRNGTLTLRDSTVSNSMASQYGGGINNSGTMTLTNSTLSDNTATSGGAVYNSDSGTMTLTDITISGNITNNGSGGGILNSGVLTLVGSTIRGNSGFSGGGISNGGTLTITNSTLSGNSARDSGGGIRNDGTMYIANSTISSNSAERGGGIYSDRYAELVNTIVADNSRGADCARLVSGQSVTSLGHNLDSDGSCDLTEPTDLPNADPLLGPLQDNGGPTLSHALLPGSPAFDAGDNSAAPPTDQRGVARPQCGSSDIGAYELELSGNCPPAAFVHTAITEEETPLPISLRGSDGDAGDILRFIIASPPTSGDLFGGPTVTGEKITAGDRALSGNTVTYAPHAGFLGSDSFTFRVNDGTADSNIATVTILTVNATLTVTKTGDTNDGNCDADCSLREAIIEANAQEGADRINVPAGTYRLSIARFGEDASETGDLDITDELTINGAGADATIIDGGGLDRVFHILTFRRVEISGVTVQNGDVGQQGGGIWNRGNLTLSDVTVSDNSASFGGGIYTAYNGLGGLIMANSTVSGNTGIDGGGGIVIASGMVTLTNVAIAQNSTGGDGGGIRGGRVTLISSTVSNNMAGGDGGGIHNDNGTLTIASSTVSGNSAGGNGGGSYNFGTDPVDIINSTFIDNSADETGGGIFARGPITLTNSTVRGNSASSGGGIGNTGTLNITNSTVSDNTASQGGGGTYNTFGGTLNIINSTISNNTATTGGGLYNGIVSRRGSGGTASLANTIIARNVASTGPDCFGSPTSVGHNLIGNTAGCGFAAASGDLVNVDPFLGPLQGSGGPTLTQALLPGSPALGAGDDSAAPASDQRGVARPQCGSSDIGAYELEPSGNCLPVARNQSVNTREDTAVTITLTGADADDESLSFTIVSQPTSGDLSLGSSIITTTPHVLAGDIITYTPNTGFFGTDKFTFKVNDGIANSNIATVVVTIPTTLTVTKTEDTDDGVCDGGCSLREAIGAANPYSIGVGVVGDTVNIPPGPTR